MCDCYTHRCAGCGAGVEMHLGDFDTERDEIEVWCEKCCERVWFEKFNDDLTVSLHQDRDDGALTGRFVAIRCLTRNAFLMQDHNHPNYGDFEVRQTAKSWGKTKKTYKTRSEKWEERMNKRGRS